MHIVDGMLGRDLLPRRQFVDRVSRKVVLAMLNYNCSLISFPHFKGVFC